MADPADGLAAGSAHQLLHQTDNGRGCTGLPATPSRGTEWFAKWQFDIGDVVH